MDFEKVFAKKQYHGKFPPTDEQWALINGIWARDGNCAGEAVAGSGKTSTVIEVMWGRPQLRIGYLVFSKEMELSMNGRVPPNTIVKTCHAFGYQALAKKVGRIHVQGGKGKPSLNKIILSQFSGYNLDVASKEDYADVKDRIDSVSDLIDKIRVNLIDWNNLEQVLYIIGYYGIEIESPDEVFAMLPKIFADIIEKGMQGVIDFTSMLWLPVYLNLPMVNDFDILLVDEYQDLSACQRKFARMLAGRSATIGIVGDRNQSIFGFAGATPNSMELGIKELKAKCYPINENFRCGRKIIESVQHIVPQIRAWSGAAEGEVIYVDEGEFDYCSIPDDSLALSRTNASLVRPAFKRIKNGKRANIKGRDLQYGLDSLHRKIKKAAGKENVSVPKLIGIAHDMEAAEIEALETRKSVSRSQIEHAQDKYETFRIVCEQVERPEDIKSQIADLFDPKKGGVVFSSMHRSKGLEAPEVYIIDCERMTLNHKDMKDWEHQQESNLVYVAQTRPKNKLVKIRKQKEKND